MLTNKEDGRKFILPLDEKEEEISSELGLDLSDTCISLDDLFC